MLSAEARIALTLATTRSCDSAAMALRWEHSVKQVMRPAGISQGDRWRLIIRAISIRPMLDRSFAIRPVALRLECSPILRPHLVSLLIRKVTCLLVAAMCFDSAQRER